MIAVRLVLDTNIVVSALLKPDGLERTVLRVAGAKPARWYVTQPIVDEYSIVLARPKFKIAKRRRQQFLRLVSRQAKLVAPSRIPIVTSDADDNIFVECADAARADYLVTGNQRDFPPFWKSTKIIGAREFLTMVAPHLLS